MKPTTILIFLSLLIINGEIAAQYKSPPLKDGEYIFEHKFAEAEQHSIKSIQLIVKIKGNHIVVVNHDRYDVFPEGILEEGELMLHPKSSQWIITNSSSDIEADDVGGCSDGPTVIDLKNRIYWTC